MAEIQALRGKEKVEKYKIQKQQCRNPKCRQFCKGYIFLKTHVMKKSQPKKCKLFYTRANNLDELLKAAETELKFMRKIAKQTLLQKHLDTAKKEFTDNVKKELGIRVNQVKVAGHGASVENGPTTMKYLDLENRTKVLDLYYCINDEEKDDLKKLLDQASVIIGVTNRIGKIHVPEFQKYVKNAYKHWIHAFNKFVHIKSSLHWTLGHVAELIARNGGYTLAEYSENSFENWIKKYRDTTDNHARQTSMEDNNIDSLRAMWLHSRQDIRQFDKHSKKNRDDDDEITKTIYAFFEINEEGKRWTFSEQ